MTINFSENNSIFLPYNWALFFEERAGAPVRNVQQKISFLDEPAGSLQRNTVFCFAVKVVLIDCSACEIFR
ncbi:MAG: hypothetical protein ACPF94_06660, partial [Candidatus Puniceispirillales bacterium]